MAKTAQTSLSDYADGSTPILLAIIQSKIEHIHVHVLPDWHKVWDFTVADSFSAVPFFHKAWNNFRLKNKRVESALIISSLVIFTEIKAY